MYLTSRFDPVSDSNAKEKKNHLCQPVAVCFIRFHIRFAFVFFLSYLTALLPSLAFGKSVDHFLNLNMLNVMAPLKGVLHW